jgi:hypothetical protein
VHIKLQPPSKVADIFENFSRAINFLENKENIFQNFLFSRSFQKYQICISYWSCAKFLSLIYQHFVPLMLDGIWFAYFLKHASYKSTRIKHLCMHQKCKTCVIIQGLGISPNWSSYNLLYKKLWPTITVKSLSIWPKYETLSLSW